MVLKTVPHLDIVSDTPDNWILECAEQADADLVVTGDADLLRLKRFGRAGIVRVALFLRTLG